MGPGGVNAQVHQYPTQLLFTCFQRFSRLFIIFPFNDVLGSINEFTHRAG